MPHREVLVTCSPNWTRSSAYVEALFELERRLRLRASSSYERSDKNDQFSALSPEVSRNLLWSCGRAFHWYCPCPLFTPHNMKMSRCMVARFWLITISTVFFWQEILLRVSECPSRRDEASWNLCIASMPSHTWSFLTLATSVVYIKI